MISAIVAAAKNGVIGQKGKIPWHLPAELAHFKEITMNHPIIMGRKTFESIGRALPGRTNIVITREKGYRAEGCRVVGSLEQALEEAKMAEGAAEIFIIGGASVYQEALPLVERIYLTKVEADVDGDKYFAFDETDWKQISSQKHKANEKNPYNYEFKILERETGLNS